MDAAKEKKSIGGKLMKHFSARGRDDIPMINKKVNYLLFYHGYCVDQSKAAFIILQQTHCY
jgi:hypothetical protein